MTQSLAILQSSSAVQIQNCPYLWLKRINHIPNSLWKVEFLIFLKPFPLERIILSFLLCITEASSLFCFLFSVAISAPLDFYVILPMLSWWILMWFLICSIYKIIPTYMSKWAFTTSQLFLLLMALFFIVLKQCSPRLVMGIQRSVGKITSLMYRRRVHAPAHQYLHSKMWLIPLRTVLVLLPCSSCWCSWHCAHQELLWCLSLGTCTLRGWVKAEWNSEEC